MCALTVNREVCGAGEGMGMDWIATKGKWGGGAHRAVKKDQKRKKRVNRVLVMGGIKHWAAFSSGRHLAVGSI